MPLPTTVVYITLAVLAAPALVQLGIPPLAAHLFLFYFGMVSLITPPDCLPVYIAASIAQAEFLANRLDRHAPRHRRLHSPVYFRASSTADSRWAH